MLGATWAEEGLRGEDVDMVVGGGGVLFDHFKMLCRSS